MKKILSIDQLTNTTNFSKSILTEILKKNIEIENVENTNIFCFNKKICVGNYTSLTPYNYGLILSNKYYSLQILKEGNISIPEGKLFNMFDKNEALAYARKIGFPVILRIESSQLPIKSVRVNSNRNFLPSFEKLSKHQENILVEKLFKGKNLKILVLKNGFYNILINKPPVIIGDGKSNILELISKENLRRINFDNKHYPIKINDQELNLKQVLKKGQMLTVFNSTNPMEGSVIEDITYNSDKSLIRIAQKILNLFPKLSYLSVNLVAKSYKNKTRKNDYVITELRLIPGVNSSHPLFDGVKIGVFGEIIADLLSNQDEHKA